MIKTSRCCVYFLLSLCLAACQAGPSQNQLIEPSLIVSPIKGKAEFPRVFRPSALVSELQPHATVSLIYPASHLTLPNRTLVTGKTEADGRFLIHPATAFQPANGELFILEAARRLGAAGQERLTLRTYLRWNGTGWQSISSAGIELNSRTTALVLMDELDDRINAEDTLGKVSTTGQTSSFSGVAGTVDSAEQQLVAGMVETLLAQYRDPARYLSYSNGRYRVLNPDNPQRQMLLDTLYCPACQLSGASLSAQDLSGAQLQNTSLQAANLNQSNLTNANLLGAQLGGANLTSANLSNAQLSGSHWPGTKFGGATWVNSMICAAESVGTCSFELRANTQQSGAQQYPEVAINASGNWLTTWRSAAQDGNGDGVYAQRFDRFGNRVGTELQINTTTLGAQYPTAVALHDNGSFAVVWTSAGQDGSGTAVIARLFAADGTPASPEIQVNQTTALDQWAGSAVFLPDGRLHVVWQSTVDVSNTDIFMRTFDTAGKPVGPELKVNDGLTGKCELPRVAVNASGRTAVVFQRDASADKNIFARFYLNDGSPVGSAFQVNVFATNPQQYPDIALNDQGQVAIVWQSNLQDRSGQGIIARVFGPSGNPLIPEFVVNQFTNFDQYNPSVSSDGQTRFSVAWYSQSQVAGTIYTPWRRAFSWNGLPQEVERKLYFSARQFQSYPRIAMNRDGLLAAAWTLIESPFNEEIGAALYGY